MNPGIFISYSRDDQKQALALLNMLRKEGYEVWIDQEAIPGASIWSDEIVQNIKACDIFICILSESSVASPNVGKEIGIAAEHGKTILPIEIGVVDLPGRLEYALAGIQKTDYHNEEAILHAIKKIGSRAEEVQAAGPQKKRKTRKKRIRQRMIIGASLVIIIGGIIFFSTRGSSEKNIVPNSVVVLPFVTMNLDQDSIRNLDVFSEAILKQLSTLRTLKLTGAAVSASYKDSPLNAIAIAHDLSSRYIVDGTVRKLDDVDFVSVRIYDVKKGGQIWEQTYRGNIRELFEIRDRVSREVFDRIRDMLSAEEALRIAEQKALADSTNAVAQADYAKILIGADKVRSLEFFQRAIKADSTNEMYYIRAGIIADRLKNRNLAGDLGARGAAVVKNKLLAHPDSGELAISYCIALDVAGRMEQSEHLYDSLMILHPKDVRMFFNAACNLSRQGKIDKALDVLEKLQSFAPGKIRETISDSDFDNVRMIPRYMKILAATD